MGTWQAAQDAQGLGTTNEAVVSVLYATVACCARSKRAVNVPVCEHAMASAWMPQQQTCMHASHDSGHSARALSTSRVPGITSTHMWLHIQAARYQLFSWAHASLMLQSSACYSRTWMLSASVVAWASMIDP